MLTAAQFSTLVYAISAHSAQAVLGQMLSPSPCCADDVACLARAALAVAADPAHVFDAAEALAIHAAVNALG